MTAEGNFVMRWHSWLGLLVVLPIALLNILEFVSEISGSNELMRFHWLNPGVL